MLWYALLIPCVLSILAFLIWHKQIIWQEMLLPTIASFVFILVSYYTIKSRSMEDIEYNGYVVKYATYHEYWSTWVEQTCSYTTCNGYDSKGNCTGYTTHYYDCSYCDENAAYWEAVDANDNHFSISQAKYLDLMKKWKATPKFQELNRDIETYRSCGVDGDMYYINWNNDINTSECSVIKVPFVNPVKVSHSAFQYPVISDKEAKKLGLYQYPEFYGKYRQQAILGMDSILSFAKYYKTNIQTKLEYINGYLGPKNKVKVFTLLFRDKPIDIAFKQEAYWSGGNQNELVVCIGLDNSGTIQWVKPFSWCDNKRIIVDTREDIAELKILNPHALYNIYEDNIQKYYHYKSFKDFNYLRFEPTMGQILFVYIGTIIVSILCLWWCIKNEFENE